MRSDLSAEELVASWTLVDEDWKLIAHRSGATRFGFSVMLKFFKAEARFPRRAGDVPGRAVAYLAEQVGVPAELFADYDSTRCSPSSLESMTAHKDLSAKFERGTELLADDSLTDVQRIAVIQAEFGAGEFEARQVIEMASGEWTSDEVQVDDDNNPISTA
jgi:hypothetical protein